VSLNSIQILRGIAAFGVVLYHAALWISPLPRFDIGAAGVDLFFVISGFIMVYASDRLFGRPGAARHFLVRRMIRIIPLYWGLTTAMVLWHGFPPNLLGSYFFIPLNRGPILTVGWTLNYEMMFYCLFAVAIALHRRAAVATLSITLVALALIPQAFGIALPMPWKDWTSPLLLEFVFGMIVGSAFCDGWRLRPAISCVMVLLAGTMIAVAQFQGLVDSRVTSDFARPFTWGTGAALIVAALALTDTRREVPLLLEPAITIGDASYALYLCHPIVFALMRAAGIPELIEPTNYPYLYAAMFSVSAIIAALIVNRVDEAARKWLLATFATSREPKGQQQTTARGSPSQAPALP
jgi:exopolysaccharide production protein ExoZ